MKEEFKGKKIVLDIKKIREEKLLKGKQSIMNRSMDYGMNIIIFIVSFGLTLISILKLNLFWSVVGFCLTIFYFYNLIEERKWYFKEYNKL